MMPGSQLILVREDNNQQSETHADTSDSNLEHAGNTRKLFESLRPSVLDEYSYEMDELTLMLIDANSFHI